MVELGMLKFSAAQMNAMGESMFRERADQALRARVPGWADEPRAEREAFLQDCLERARAHRLTSEQGIISYALGAWWLGSGFEHASALLLQMLAAPLPELRRCQGMNDWVADQLHRDATPDSGDDAIRRSFALTEPWGRT